MRYIFCIKLSNNQPRHVRRWDYDKEENDFIKINCEK